MTRKRKSPILDKAQRRLSGLKYLNPTMDLGNGVNVQAFATLTEELRVKLNAYNAMVDLFDQRREEIEALEKALAPKAEKMLNAVASIYGKDSDEYEMAGGIKRVRQTPLPNSEDDLSPSETLLMPNLLLNVVEEGIKNGRGN